MNYCITYKLNADKTYEQCDTLEWGKQMEEMRKNHTKHVAMDEIDGDRVSTVWLGLDHQWNDGPPLLFETMIFEKDDWHEIYCERYSTWEQAEEGHQKAIQWLKEKLKEKHEATR